MGEATRVASIEAGAVCIQLCKWEKGHLLIALKNQSIPIDLASASLSRFEICSQGSAVASFPCIFTEANGGLWSGAIDCRQLAELFDESSVRTLSMRLALDFENRTLVTPPFNRASQHKLAFSEFTSGFFINHSVLIIPDESKASEYVIRVIGRNADASKQPYAMKKKNRPYENLVLLESLSMDPGITHQIGGSFRNGTYRLDLSTSRRAASWLFFDDIQPGLKFEISDANNLGPIEPDKKLPALSLHDFDNTQPYVDLPKGQVETISSIRTALFLADNKKRLDALDVSKRESGHYAEIDHAFEPYFKLQLTGKLASQRIPIMIDANLLVLAVEDLLCYRGDAEGACNIASIWLNCAGDFDMTVPESLVNARDAAFDTVKMRHSFDNGHHDEAIELARRVLSIFPYAIEAQCVHLLVESFSADNDHAESAITELEKQLNRSVSMLPLVAEAIIMWKISDSESGHALAHLLARDSHDPSIVPYLNDLINIPQR